MTATDHWLLPSGVAEVLPGQAWQLEQLRRRLLDLYQSWGYELVMPPFIEFLDSLLTGTGNDLDLQTFKLTDQLSGRLLGVRADMTPQAARIDAHQLKREEPARLCYLGTVLRTRPTGLDTSRSPLQVGAELFGHAGSASELEVLGLMLETLRAVHIEECYLDVGHVGIFRGLAANARLSAQAEADLFDCLQRKALPEIEQLLAALDISSESRSQIMALAELHGDARVLERARGELGGAGEEVLQALSHVQTIADEVARRWPHTPVNFDLAELRGYNYHTGLVFAAFAPGSGQEVARGGRYDQIGEVFGRARPAVGFSTDLKLLMSLGGETMSPPAGIFVEQAEDTTQFEKVRALRAAGERVICALPGQAGDARSMGCDRVLVRNGGEWQVRALAD